MKIMIVEDEENISDGIVAILQSCEEYKCQIKVTDNGKKALDIAQKWPPDLVITDIRMFYMNGLELAETLKGKGLCDKIIIISGYSNFEYAQKALRINVLDYLLKPIDKNQLLDLVGSVWRNLPSNYAGNKRKLPDNDFFCLNLRDDGYPPSLKKIIAYMDKNYMQNISLQTLSEELMLHPNYISTLINKHTRVSFSYLLDYIRLVKACELLGDPEMTVAEISYIVGYNNERRLYHAFQKRMSCTPGDFRKIQDKER